MSFKRVIEGARMKQKRCIGVNFAYHGRGEIIFGGVRVVMFFSG
jgi:hypothetical protein